MYEIDENNGVKRLNFLINASDIVINFTKVIIRIENSTSDVLTNYSN